MMTVNGERVWVPSAKQDLIAGLHRMGIYKVAGEALGQLTVKQLTVAYCRERALVVRRQQAERRRLQEPIASSNEESMIQLKLVPN